MQILVIVGTDMNRTSSSSVYSYVHLNYNNNTRMHKQNTNHVPQIEVYIKCWTGRLRGTV